MPARDWGDKLVCYVCQTEHIDPDDCRPVNVIIAGYGVCLDHQHTIIRGLKITYQTDLIIAQRVHEEPMVESTERSAQRTAERLGVPREDIR